MNKTLHRHWRTIYEEMFDPLWSKLLYKQHLPYKHHLGMTFLVVPYGRFECILIKGPLNHLNFTTSSYTSTCEMITFYIPELIRYMEYPLLPGEKLKAELIMTCATFFNFSFLRLITCHCERLSK